MGIGIEYERHLFLKGGGSDEERSSRQDTRKWCQIQPGQTALSGQRLGLSTQATSREGGSPASLEVQVHGVVCKA